MARYSAQPAANRRIQGEVFAVVTEMGAIGLGALAARLGISEGTARANAEVLCETGDLRAIPGTPGRGGRKRRYLLPEPEAGDEVAVSPGQGEFATAPGERALVRRDLGNGALEVETAAGPELVFAADCAMVGSVA